MTETIEKGLSETVENLPENIRETGNRNENPENFSENFPARPATDPGENLTAETENSGRGSSGNLTANGASDYGVTGNNFAPEIGGNPVVNGASGYGITGNNFVPDTGRGPGEENFTDEGFAPGFIPGYGIFGSLPLPLFPESRPEPDLNKAAKLAFGEGSGVIAGENPDRREIIGRAMEKDLRQIRLVNPRVKSLGELPPVYRVLRFNSFAPMDAEQAYSRAMAITGPKPASTGSMAAAGAPEREYFTGRELDRLGAEDLKDPAVYRKAMKSLTRL